MIPSIRPISYEENKEASDRYGRALFVYQNSDTGIRYPLFVRNLVDVERDPTSPAELKKIVHDVWTTLSTDDGIITSDLLRHTLGGRSPGDILLSELVERNPNTTKQIQNAKSLSTQPSIASSNQHPLSVFFASKFGVMVLRHLLDLPSQSMRQMKNPLLGHMSIQALDKAFVEAPSSCLYIRSLSSASRKKQNKNYTYERLIPSYKYGMSPLLKDANESLPSEDDFHMLNATNPDYTYIYGQVRSGYLGYFGNLFTSNEEFEERKNAIKASMTARENYARKNNTSYKPYQMYDSYAGQRDMSKALYEAILLDAPSYSVHSTLSAMKRNLIMLVYIGLSYLEYRKSPPNDQQGEDIKEICEDLGEAFLAYFRPSQGKKAQVSTRCPIKVAGASRRPYAKLEEKVMRWMDPDLRNKRWVEKLEGYGASREKLEVLEQMTDNTYHHLPIRNVLSGNDLMDGERHGLTDSFDEGDSLVMVPLQLNSYWDKQDMSGAPPKVIGGMWTHSNPYQMKMVPTYVCKASCIYGRKPGVEVESTEADKKDDKKIFDLVKGLLDCGMTREETYQNLSLNEKQRRVISEMLDSKEDESPAKRLKLCT